MVYNTENVNVLIKQGLGIAKWICWKQIGTEGYKGRPNLCYGQEQSEEVIVKGDDGKSGEVKELEALMRN